MAEPQIEHDFNERPADAVQAPDLTENAIEDYSRQASSMVRHPQSSYGAVDRKGDDALIVEFFIHALNGDEYIRLQAPGDEYKILVEPVTDEYRFRFARQYEAFKARESQYAGQSMLSDMPWMNKATQFHLAKFRVVTVEQLSTLPDSSVDKMGLGVRALREKAQKYLRVDNNVHEQMHGLESAVAERDARLAEQMSMMAEMQKQIQALQERTGIAGEEKTAPARRAKASAKKLADAVAGTG